MTARVRLAASYVNVLPSRSHSAASTTTAGACAQITVAVWYGPVAGSPGWRRSSLVETHCPCARFRIGALAPAGENGAASHCCRWSELLQRSKTRCGGGLGWRGTQRPSGKPVLFAAGTSLQRVCWRWQQAARAPAAGMLLHAHDGALGADTTHSSWAARTSSSTHHCWRIICCGRPAATLAAPLLPLSHQRNPGVRASDATWESAMTWESSCCCRVCVCSHAGILF
jgi:hypothetical protein